jgi:hypothetical protein
VAEKEVVRALTCNDRRHREGKLDPIKGKVNDHGGAEFNAWNRSFH